MMTTGSIIITTRFTPPLYIGSIDTCRFRLSPAAVTGSKAKTEAL